MCASLCCRGRLEAGSEHDTCKGPVAEGSPALSRSKDGAGTARAACGDFPLAKPGSWGHIREGSKNRAKNLDFFLRATGNS